MSELMYEVTILFSSKAAAEICVEKITRKIGPLSMHIREFNPDAHPE